MPNQDIVNWLFSGFGLILGFVLNGIWQSIKDLQESDKALVERMCAIEILIAGTYVKKDEFLQTISALFDKLDKIEDKVDKID